MQRFINILFIVTSLVLGINWILTGDPGKFFFIAHKLEVKSENITDVDVEFADRKVYLNVHLKAPTTCKSVIDELGINNIMVSSKMYSPVCEVMNPELIRIIYSEIKDSV